MKKIVSRVVLAALVATATSSQAEFSLQRGFDETCNSGGTLLFGGLGLFFATIGITIAEEHEISAKELLYGQYDSNRYLFPFIQMHYVKRAPSVARTNVILSLASFAMLARLCISNGTSPSTPSA